MLMTSCFTRLSSLYSGTYCAFTLRNPGARYRRRALEGLSVLRIYDGFAPERFCRSSNASWLPTWPTWKRLYELRLFVSFRVISSIRMKLALVDEITVTIHWYLVATNWTLRTLLALLFVVQPIGHPENNQRCPAGERCFRLCSHLARCVVSWDLVYSTTAS